MINKLKTLVLSGFIIFSLSIATKGIAQNKEQVKLNDKVHFIEDNWKEALKQAAAQHKYIFVDAYATWCGPCKMLKNQTFTNPKAAEFYNKNFINLSMDMEKGMGPQLASEWGITAYPTLIVFNSKGKPVSGTMGFMPATDLIKFGQDALTKKM